MMLRRGRLDDVLAADRDGARLGLEARRRRTWRRGSSPCSARTRCACSRTRSLCSGAAGWSRRPRTWCPSCAAPSVAADAQRHRLRVAVQDHVQLLLASARVTGVFMSKPCSARDALQQASVPVRGRSPVRVQGTIAPSASDRFLFGMTSSGSISIFTPRPVQSGQAPWGLLKLKLRGASSPNDRPQ